MGKRVWYWGIGLAASVVICFLLADILALPPDVLRKDISGLALANKFRPMNAADLPDYDLHSVPPIYDAFERDFQTVEEWNKFATTGHFFGNSGIATITSITGPTSLPEYSAPGAMSVRSSDDVGVYTIRSVFTETVKGHVHVTLAFKRTPTSVKERFSKWMSTHFGSRPTPIARP